MMVDFWVKYREEVIRFDPHHAHGEQVLWSRRKVRIDGEETTNVQHPHPEIIQGNENEAPNAELTRGNEANRPDTFILQQIVKSPRNSNSNRTTQNEENSTPCSLFGMYLGACRRRKGMTVEDLANASGIPADLVARIELGDASLPEIADCLPGLSKALEVSVTKLSRLLMELIIA